MMDDGWITVRNTDDHNTTCLGPQHFQGWNWRELNNQLDKFYCKYSRVKGSPEIQSQPGHGMSL